MLTSSWIVIDGNCPYNFINDVTMVHDLVGNYTMEQFVDLLYTFIFKHNLVHYFHAENVNFQTT